MFLTFVTFFVALSLSAIAAYYSIAGLAAIFAAAVLPIVIMGGILEVAKLNVTLWLHRYWGECRWIMKLYLVPAVVVLMLITSMGIFGFLSKAHIEQGVTTTDAASQVAIIDERIRIFRENIDSQRVNIDLARNAVKLLDEQVTARIGMGFDDGRSAERAVQIRRQQRAEREALAQEISKAQDEIQRLNDEIGQLNQERIPVAAALRQVEAEVGPIKYIAALIYGDQTDAALLEKAVRWVIVVLVAVFDPLAVMMLLAASESLKWERQRRAQALLAADTVAALPEESQPPPADAEPPPDPTPDDPEPDIPDTPPTEVPPPGEPVDDHHAANYEPDDGALSDDQVQQIQESIPDPPPEPVTDVESTLFDIDDDPEVGDTNEYEKNLLRKAKTLWKIDNPGATLKEQRRLFEAGKISHLPWEDYIPKVLASQVLWGREQPQLGNKGDFWIDVGQVPTQLYKHNGDTWIPVDKNLTDQYVYDDTYIQHLIEEIAQGHYDPDLLTESEKREIEKQLNPAV